MLKRLLLATLPLALSGATKPATQLEPGQLYPQVHQIVCAEGKGTGFDSDRGVLSVAHVTESNDCRIGGRPIFSLKDKDSDFSVVLSERPHAGFKVNCEGFKGGEYYFAVGYARGWKWQTMVMLMATTQTVGGQTLLLGPPTVIPGMSGGPVLNAAGEVVGTVNRYSPIYPLSFSQPLSDTSVCKDHAHA